MAFTIQRSRPEQQVNVLTEDNQVRPSVAGLPDGGWVVTWTGQDQNGTGIYMQRYDANGVPQSGTERLINTRTEGSQIYSSIVALKDDETIEDDGGWVVTWLESDPGGGGATIYQQRFNANGVAQSGAETVANPTRPADDKPHVEMTALPDGGWIMTWQSADGSNYGIYQQRYNAAGEPQLGTGQLVNVSTDGYQYQPDVITLSNGGWLVVWADGGPFDSSSNIFMRRYGPDGNVEEVTTAPGMQTSPEISALPGGGWVAVWYGVAPDGSTDIFMKQYDAGGIGGSTRVVNMTTYGEQVAPHVAVLTDGSWVVTWQSGSDIMQRYYDSDGNTVGEDMVVAAWLGSDLNRYPRVEALSDGRWVITWENLNQDEFPGSGIAQRVFSRDAIQEITGDAETATGTALGETLNVRAGGLSEGDVLDAGGEDDVLQMVEAGEIDLTLPNQLLNFEILNGSIGDDRIVANADRLGQFTTLNGGGGDDTLALFSGDNYDLSGKTFIDIDKIELTDYVDYSVTVSDVATALLIHGGEGTDTVRISSGTLSLEDRIRIFSQGVEKIDVGGTVHVNAVPVIDGLADDRARALVGGSARLDVGGNAAVTEDLGRFRSLSVKIANRVAGEDELGFAVDSGVTIVDGRVSVGGQEIGTLEKDGKGAAGLEIEFFASADPDLVEAVLRGLIYINTASGSFVPKQRDVVITLVDAAGAQAT